MKLFIIVALALLALIFFLHTSKYEGVCDTAEYMKGFRCRDTVNNTVNNAVKCKEKCYAPSVWKTLN